MVVDGGEADVQVEGDLVVGPAFEKSFEHLLTARGWNARGTRGVGACAVGGEPRGAGDFAAVEEAGGEMGDDLVPEVAIDTAEAAEVVTAEASEALDLARDVN